jgi:NhaA family Na+:H+ antiporter
MQQAQPPAHLARLPPEPVDRLLGPVSRFLHVEAASGVILLLATVAALALANSGRANEFLTFWQLPIGFKVGAFDLTYSLRHWINDGLMTIFFFVIGLEVKRELVLGELRDLRTASLPIAAAIGGMLVPACVYLALQWGKPGEGGWAIPMATDIAFVVGCLAILGSRVPPALRILLLSLAIADDIGAILVIALVFTDHLNGVALLLGVMGIGGVVGLARVGVRSVPVYFIVGTLVWLAWHASGIHPTIAGVILGLLTPAQSWVSERRFQAITQKMAGYFEGAGRSGATEERSPWRSVELAARETASPLERLETRLHPWVSFGIMPLFACANAGVALSPAEARHPVALAVMVGLVVGKPVGIVCFSWIAVRSGIARLPEGVSWGVLAAGGMLAGIGFTMALFIASLALKAPALDAAKVGILSASATCAVTGSLILLWLLRKFGRA